MLYYKENFEQSKEYFDAYWNLENHDRCLLSMTMPRKDGKVLPPPQPCSLEERYTNPLLMHESMLRGCEQNVYLYEALPSALPYFGTAAECEYFGCKPGYAPETIWFDPVLHEPDADKMVYDPTAFERQKQYTRELVKLAGNQYLVGMNDNCGIIDGLAQLRGVNELLFDMVDNPEFVHAARDKILAVWKDTQKEFFEIIKENNFGGSSHAWMSLWSDKRHLQLQCDYSCMISPAMFEEFVLPELEETSAAFEHCSYHLDGIEQLRHLDMILSVKTINNIQWTHVAGQPKVSENIEALKKIQKAGKGLVLIPQRDEIDFLTRNLSPEGVIICVGGVKDLEEAKAIEKLVSENARIYR